MKNSAKVILIFLVMLSTIAVIIMVWLAVQRIKHVDSPPPLSPSADSLKAITIEQLEHNLAENSKILERPLFWQERRPYVAKKKPLDRKPVLQEEEADPFDKVKLIGVYSGGAIFIVDGEKQRLYLGDEVAGWTLDLMNADSVIFVQGSENKVLQLEHATVKAVKAKPAKAKTAINKANRQIIPPSQPIKEQQNRNVTQKLPSRIPQPDNKLPITTIENGALQPVLDLN